MKETITLRMRSGPMTVPLKRRVALLGVPGFALHREGWGWAVSHVETGLAASHGGRIQAEAIAEAERKLAGYAERWGLDAEATVRRVVAEAERLWPRT